MGKCMWKQEMAKAALPLSPAKSHINEQLPIELLILKISTPNQPYPLLSNFLMYILKITEPTIHSILQATNSVTATIT